MTEMVTAELGSRSELMESRAAAHADTDGLTITQTHPREAAAESRGEPLQIALKAVLDRSVALILLAVLTPILAAIAVAVRISSPGPAIYRQRRVGLEGREFTVYKFRTMTTREATTADEDDLCHLAKFGDGPFKPRLDPRITPLGRHLRRHSLDELPQLWNVITGSMSLVGPRPQTRLEVSQYTGDTMRRLRVKPGMTGLWQVSGRADLTWAATVRLDLEYVDRRSLWFDIVLLARTVAVVFHGRGAY